MTPVAGFFPTRPRTPLAVLIGPESRVIAAAPLGVAGQNWVALSSPTWDHCVAVSSDGYAAVYNGKTWVAQGMPPPVLAPTRRCC